MLVGGRNFGCGSSREHAPQSLIRWGLKAVIAESFAEIFFGNCTSLGMPCVTAARADLARLCEAIKQDPQLSITVDIVTKTIRYGSESVACEMLESARSALVTGQWDFLSQLLAGQDAIRQTAKSLPYLHGFGA